MMLYRKTKVKVRSPVGDTDYFYFVAGVRLGDILVPYVLIICLDYVLRTSIDKMKQTETSLHSLERATACIGLRVNAHRK